MAFGFQEIALVVGAALFFFGTGKAFEWITVAKKMKFEWERPLTPDEQK